jgi:hypothetical protein
MLLISIINKLLKNKVQFKSFSNISTLSFFLCQESDSHLNNITAILRDLVYLFIKHQLFLMSFLQEKYDSADQKLFENINTFFSLSEVLHHMLQNSRLSTVYFVINALNKYNNKLPQFLDLITQTASDQLTHVK